MSMVRRDRVFSFLAPPLEEVQVDTRHGPILYVEDVSVSFDGFKALNNLNLYIDDGELRCIIGPNGAGKTTMMDVITGKTKPDTGTVYFGQSLSLLSFTEPEIAQLGVGRKFQRPTVFENLTVRDNLELAVAKEKRPFSTVRVKAGWREQERIDELTATVGLEDALAIVAARLSHGQKQWLEIGMLLAQDPRLLLVDEPVAGMTHEETERTAELLTSLAGKHTVVVVEHDMEFIRSIARKVTVLHEGSVLAEGDMASVQADPRVMEVYLGE